MKRKVNLVGTSTHTVSLPTKWVKESNLKKGDELEVLFDKDKITFSKLTLSKEEKEITLNIDNFTYSSLSKYLGMLYITGFDKIILIYSKQEIFYPKKQENVNLKKIINTLITRLLGAEIVSQSSTKTEIKCFVAEETLDLDKIEKRVYFLLKETTNELLKSIGPDFHKFSETAYDHHNHIVKFIFYFLRMLYQSNRSEEEKRMAFSFYFFLDHLVDNIRHISEKIDEYGCTAKVKKYLEEIFEFFYNQFDFLWKEEINGESINERYKLKRKIDEETFTVKELKVISEAMIFLDVLNEFCGYIIAKNVGKK